ncbi:hypothetical protein COT97_03550 [Candidatus Falkowbacteria bacterium CG10_big_fil_rev_8_21_14_0_10_39_11]|uniref:Rod shape-determining protein MreD n=1 Tax=Candidatus Falkowbacteria bacterium CG10_big_fil_rev_8_21_14_0_10_39_11 TaxID=1974565 RepID=A0A2H0V4K3_9BACT|nr:MAG: hypothetical protein COT97_03550 [Candidatus Falkowbacteria bacterium CG10_big_fil_rev_8_21_14_0_10_39_11]
MIFKGLKYFLLILFIVLIELSILPQTGGWVKMINVFLLILTLIYLTKGFNTALALSLIIGPIMDLYHLILMPSITFCLVVTIFFMDSIFSRLFTNKSYYSFISMILLSVLVYNVLIKGIYGLQTMVTNSDFYLFSWSPSMIGGYLATLLFVNFIAGTILFLSSYFFSNNFKSVILRD